MLRRSDLVWFVLAAITVTVGRARADVITPGVDVVAPSPVFEGAAPVVTVTITNPSTTAPLDISELIVAVPFIKNSGDTTDALTLKGASVRVAGCAGLNIPGISPQSTTLTLAAGASCTDNILIPTVALTVPDEGKPDFGMSSVDITAVTPEGIHSANPGVPVQVNDVPEPSSLLLVGSGLLALSMSWKTLRGRLRA